MASIRLRLLGCGDAFSSGGRLHTCFHLEGGEEPMLLDCGATALVSLKRERIDPASIGWIALSHLHGDHFGGLTWLLTEGRLTERTRPLVIAGPPTAQERLKQASEGLYAGSSGAETPFDVSFLEFSERTPCELGPSVVTPFEVVHSSGAPSFALRVQYGGKVVAYSGDTEWTDSLIDAARGADVFICECNNFEQPVAGHLNYRTVVEKRSQLECSRLVLTHLGEEVLDHLDELELETAEDGLVLEL
jgi:ribonuclease BN (tRNA processing enzyme)